MGERLVEFSQLRSSCWYYVHDAILQYLGGDEKSTTCRFRTINNNPVDAQPCWVISAINNGAVVEIGDIP